MARPQQVNVGTVDVDYADVLKNLTVTVNVTGVKNAKFRLWFAIRIIAIGVWVSGMGLRIEDDTQ